MTSSVQPIDVIDDEIAKAAKHLAYAVTLLRSRGDVEYAAILQSVLHGMERPYWLSDNPAFSQVLPSVPAGVHP